MSENRKQPGVMPLKKTKKQNKTNLYILLGKRYWLHYLRPSSQTNQSVVLQVNEQSFMCKLSVKLGMNCTLYTLANMKEIEADPEAVWSYVL